MKRIFIYFIRLYQKHISAHTRSHCRFVPTCSQYAVEAFEIHGAFKGFFLTLYRIIRCNPFCKGGYDPVPEKRKGKN